MWYIYIEVGVLVASCSLMRPMWHLLSPIGPSPHNLYFHFHFSSLTILLLSTPPILTYEYPPIPTPEHRGQPLLWSGSIGRFSCLIPPDLYPLHWLFNSLLPFSLSPPHTQRPQKASTYGGIWAMLLPQGMSTYMPYAKYLTYKRLVIFMNINELEMGIGKIILHEEMTEMITFNKRFT